jgi:hypothetical protein
MNQEFRHFWTQQSQTVWNRCAMTSKKLIETPFVYIDYKIINNLSPFFEKEFESLTIEISTLGKKIILSNVYRSPSPSPNQTASSQMDLFINRFDSHLHNLFQLNPTSFVFLDSNINLLKLANNQTSLDYLETIHSNGYLQIISKATRIVGDSFSLIDHNLCKNYDPTLFTGTLATDISDHFMNLVCFSANHKSKPNNNSKYMRSFSFQNMTNFRNALNNIRWHSVYATDDVNLSFNNFWDTFSALYDLHFPLTKFTLNRNIHSLNDFMTTALLISRKRKLELHKLSLAEVGTHNFLLSPQPQFRNLKETLPQSQFRNFLKKCCSTTATPQSQFF